jgi:hypothetical protein
MEEDIQLMKDKQLYEKHIQEEKEKEQEEAIQYSIDEDSPIYKVDGGAPSNVYTSTDINNLTNNPVVEPSDETEEELEEEDLDGISLLSTIANEPEDEETKTITIT